MGQPFKTLYLTEDEQGAILMHCTGMLPGEIVQRLFSAQGKLELTAAQCDQLRKALKEKYRETRDETLKRLSVRLEPEAEDMNKDPFLEAEESARIAALNARTLRALIIDHAMKNPSRYYGLSNRHLIDLFLDASCTAVKFSGSLSYEQVKDAPIYSNIISLAGALKWGKSLTYEKLFNFAAKNWFITSPEVVPGKGQLAGIEDVFIPEAIELYETAGLIEERGGRYHATDILTELSPRKKAGLFYKMLVEFFFTGRMDLHHGVVAVFQETIGYALYRLGKLELNERGVFILNERNDGLVIPYLLDAELLKMLRKKQEEVQEMILEYQLVPLEYAGLAGVARFRNSKTGAMRNELTVCPRYYDAVSFNFDFD